MNNLSTAMQYSPIVKYFFDTEFVEYQDRLIPVSIGVISESGNTYYAEFDTDWERWASPWVLENVKPHLEGNPKSVQQVREELIRYAGSLDCQFWAYFASSDWVVMCQVMGSLKNLPGNWQPFVMDLAWLDPSLKKIRAVPFHNLKAHHALWDARELRHRYQTLTKKSSLTGS